MNPNPPRLINGGELFFYLRRLLFLTISPMDGLDGLIHSFFLFFTLLTEVGKKPPRIIVHLQRPWL